MSDLHTRKGNIVIGATLVLTGVAIVLERAGVVHWREQWTLWPLILGGIGLARFLQSIPGEPKQGLLFMTLAAWLLLDQSGWVSLADSWPIFIIAFGLMVAFNGLRRPRWHTPETAGEPGAPTHRRMRRPDHPLSPLATVGIWIAIFVGLQVSGISGIRSFGDGSAGSGGRVRVVSVMGKSEHTSRATPFQGAEVTNVMGRAELDLHDAQLAPGANATVHVFSAMGAVVLRVPANWTVDTGAISAIGGVQDERFPAAEAEAEAPANPPPPGGQAAPAPRLVIRGLVLAGRLSIRS